MFERIIDKMSVKVIESTSYNGKPVAKMYRKFLLSGRTVPIWEDPKYEEAKKFNLKNGGSYSIIELK